MGDGKFKKGQIPWNKGKTGIYSDDTINKIKLARSKQIITQETINKVAAKNTGKKRSDETKKKMSNARIGIIFTKEHLKNLSDSHKGIKPSKETKIKMSDAHKGDKSYMWLGGTSKKGYSIDWTNTLKRSIRERDHYQCQICGKNQEDRAHSVHHIDYNKDNCNPDNLITLCCSCHQQTNHKREYWTEYFKSIKKNI